MKQTQKSPSLFSAIVARLANKFKVFPEKGKIIVDGRAKTPNERTGIMNENETAVAVEEVAPEVVDGPVEVRTRKGKKGPGTLVVIVPNKADSETVVETLKANVEDGVMVFTSDHKTPTIVSATDWLAAREALVERDTQRANLLASLSPEEKALLGL